MIDPQNPHSVVRALGQPSLDAIGRAVLLTRADLKFYRSATPALAARHTQRGILNWIHDQFFAHASAEFERTVEGAWVVDSEPTREIYVGNTFRFRFKKHAADDMVSSYPTQSYLDFTSQQPLPRLQQIRLMGGYRWDAEAREIGAPVLSARSGSSSVLWALELEATGDEGSTTHFEMRAPQDALPPLPTIVESPETEEGTGSE